VGTSTASGSDDEPELARPSARGTAGAARAATLAALKPKLNLKVRSAMDVFFTGGEIGANRPDLHQRDGAAATDSRRRPPTLGGRPPPLSTAISAMYFEFQSAKRLLLRSLSPLSHRFHPSFAGSVAISPDGGRVACACGDEVKVLELATGRVLRTLPGDEEPVTAICFGHTGDHVWVASRSLTQRRFELGAPADADGDPSPVDTPCRASRTWRGHAAPVLDLCVDPTGQFLATAAADGTVKVWDTGGGFATHSLGGHGAGALVTRALFHPNPPPGRPRLATATSNGEVRVWCLAERRALSADRDHHAGAVTCMAFADGGRLLLTGGRDGTVVARLSDTGAVVATVPTFDPVEGLAVLPTRSDLPGSRRTSPDGPRGGLRIAVVGAKGKLCVWDHLTGECTYEAPALGTEGAAAGTYVDLLPVPVSGADAAGAAEAVAAAGMAGLGGDVRLLAVTADERLLLIGPDGDGRAAGAGAGADDAEAAGGAGARVSWPDARGRPGSARLQRELCGHVAEVTDLRLLALRSSPALESDADTITALAPTHAAVATSSEAVRVICLRTLSCAATLGGTHGHRGPVLALDQHHLRRGRAAGRAVVATGGKDATVRLWDAPTGACLAVGEGHLSAVAAVALAPMGGSFLVSVGADRQLKLWDVAPALQALSRLARYGRADAEAGVADPARLSVVAAQPAGDRDATCVAVSPNDRIVATGGGDKVVRLWNAPDLSAGPVLRGHRRTVWGLAFSPADRLLASAGGDGVVRIWALRDGSCLRTLEGHQGSALRVAWCTGGAQLLTGGADGTLRLWSNAGAECLKALEAHDGRVWALAVGGRGGGVVATGGSDAVVKIWEDCTGEDERDARARAEAAARGEQDLLNALRTRDWGRAARLAFRLGQPGRLLRVVEEVERVGGADDAAVAEAAAAAAGPGPPPNAVGRAPRTGAALLLEGLAAQMTPAETRTALAWAREWNTSAKRCGVAQALLRALFSVRPTGWIADAAAGGRVSTGVRGAGGRLVDDERDGRKRGGGKRGGRGGGGGRDAPPPPARGAAGAAEAFDGIAAYTRRHLARADRLLRATYLLDYVLGRLSAVGTPNDDDAAAKAKAKATAVVRAARRREGTEPEPKLAPAEKNRGRRAPVVDQRERKTSSSSLSDVDDVGAEPETPATSALTVPAAPLLGGATGAGGRRIRMTASERKRRTMATPARTTGRKVGGKRARG